MLDKIKNTLDKGIATVGVRSEVLVESSKINSLIVGLQRSRAQYVSQMGEAMYQMWAENSFDRGKFQRMCQEIEGCDRAIAEQNQRLAQLKMEERQILGKAEAPAAPEPAADGLCSCGNRNPADARFCSSCGARFQ